MPLPDLICMEPLRHLLPARVVVPGSKSVTNRALVLAALAHGTVRLEGSLWSEDTQVMVDALHRLGLPVRVDPDPMEPANRILTVTGCGGRLPAGGTRDAPLDLFVGNAGTAARFLTALTCLGTGTYRLHGVPRMHERPQRPLIQALRQLGYRLDTPNDSLPVIVHGSGPRTGNVHIGLEGSSQFASALLLCARAGHWTVHVGTSGTGEAGIPDADFLQEEAPYVEMTRQMVEVFPDQGGTFMVEPDASSGSYFLAADWLRRVTSPAGSPPPRIEVPGWPDSGWQKDADFPRYLPLPERVSRRGDLADSILTAMILAPWGGHPVTFTDLGRLRVQECERVEAMRTELSRCGARVVEVGDTLTLHPGPLHGAEIETYNDHRIAMCFAILGLHLEGMKIRNPGCVRKTFPNFFQKLSQPPPAGLGARLSIPGQAAPLDPETWNIE